MTGSDEFDEFALETLETSHSSGEHCAPGGVQRLPVDDQVLDALQAFQQCVRTMVIDLQGRPKANQRYVHGGLRKQLL
ncbi:hypothetical protein [Pseudomonas sp. MWU16-30323]|uniref:hypothetical protein n=1 Tax=Pseudomonas sp. MWU16-30323 TaxID=2878094 RepID=UPI001CFA0B71|nr:hypothetical protein [Pseudomonas sp. MWU16-30323]